MPTDWSRSELNSDGSCTMDKTVRDDDGHVISHEQYKGQEDWKGDVIPIEKTSK